MECFEYESHSNTDPTMLIHHAPTTWHSDYTFTSMTNNGGSQFTNRINLVISSTDTSYLKLDGSALVATWSSIGSTGYSAAEVSVSTGVHQIMSTNGQFQCHTVRPEIQRVLRSASRKNTTTLRNYNNPHDNGFYDNHSVIYIPLCCWARKQ